MICSSTRQSASQCSDGMMSPNSSGQLPPFPVVDGQSTDLSTRFMPVALVQGVPSSDGRTTSKRTSGTFWDASRCAGESIADLTMSFHCFVVVKRPWPWRVRSSHVVDFEAVQQELGHSAPSASAKPSRRRKTCHCTKRPGASSSWPEEVRRRGSRSPRLSLAFYGTPIKR